MSDGGANPERRRSPGRRLTDRQAAVLDLIAAGLGNKEIGRRIGISEQAVKEHVSALLRNFAAPNRAALADAAAVRRFVGTLDMDAEWTRYLFQDAPLQVAVLAGPEHRFVATNELYRATLPDVDWLGRAYAEVFPDRGDSLALLGEAYRTGRRVTRMEVARPLTRRAGEPVEAGFVSIVAQPLPGPSGSPAGVAIFKIDVTDVVRARERLAQLEREQLAILDLVTMGVVVYDERLNVVKANAAARALIAIPDAIRLTPDVAEAYRLRDPIDGRAVPYEDTPAMRALRGERCEPRVYRVRDPRTGDDRLFSISAVPLRDDEGRIRGCVSTFHQA